MIAVQGEQIGNLGRRNTEFLSNAALIQPLFLCNVVNAHAIADELRHVLVARDYDDGMAQARHARRNSPNDIVCFVVINLKAGNADSVSDLSTVFKLCFEVGGRLFPVRFITLKDTIPEGSIFFEDRSHIFRFTFFDNAKQCPQISQYGIREHTGGRDNIVRERVISPEDVIQRVNDVNRLFHDWTGIGFPSSPTAT